MRRDEEDKLSGVDPYLQAEWEGGPWVLTAGLRHSRLKVEVDDFYRSNGDDSGGVGVPRHDAGRSACCTRSSPVLNVYASAARGFETPTLNELFYSRAGAGFNFGLQPATSTHVEGGVKAIVGSSTRVNAALFQVRTDDELVVDTSGGGRTSYRNASETLRQGAELSRGQLASARGLSARLALTALRAIYETRLRRSRAGSRLPGVPNANLFGELAWKDKADRFGAALETIASSKVYAEDTNTEIPAPGYGVLNARVQAKQTAGRWNFSEFVRLNNVLDRELRRLSDRRRREQALLRSGARPQLAGWGRARSTRSERPAGRLPRIQGAQGIGGRRSAPLCRYARARLYRLSSSRSACHKLRWPACSATARSTSACQNGGASLSTKLPRPRPKCATAR